MFSKLFLIVAICSIGMMSGIPAAAQDAAALAAALDKNKYKKKEKIKNGVDHSVELYIDIKHVPVVRTPEAYSGRYADEHGGFNLDLKVASDGSAEGSGVDTINGDSQANKITFTLKNARVNGAVLTATKMFADGRSEQLEAIFVNRTTLTGKNASTIESRDARFGLGFIQQNDRWTNRVFLSPR